MPFILSNIYIFDWGEILDIFIIKELYIVSKKLRTKLFPWLGNTGNCSSSLFA